MIPLAGKIHAALPRGSGINGSHISNSYSVDKNSPVNIVSARAGNVIGGGDWAEDLIVPDCMRAWSQKKVVEIRSPGATRPWQHVLEPLSGYLSLGEHLAASWR
jgi:CDP-glucose 4,6-dehydratase